MRRNRFKKRSEGQTLYTEGGVYTEWTVRGNDRVGIITIFKTHTRVYR